MDRLKLLTTEEVTSRNANIRVSSSLFLVGELGAFAKNPLHENDIIAYYVGQRTTINQIEAHDDRYAISLKGLKGDDTMISPRSPYDDATDAFKTPPFCLAAFCNDVVGTDLETNALFDQTKYYRIDQTWLAVALVATRSIRVDEEILVRYGDEYWTRSSQSQSQHAQASIVLRDYVAVGFDESEALVEENIRNPIRGNTLPFPAFKKGRYDLLLDTILLHIIDIKANTIIKQFSAELSGMLDRLVLLFSSSVRGEVGILRDVLEWIHRANALNLFGPFIQRIDQRRLLDGLEQHYNFELKSTTASLPEKGTTIRSKSAEKEIDLMLERLDQFLGAFVVFLAENEKLGEVPGVRVSPRRRFINYLKK
jgi:hypothetical protein